MKLGGAGEGGQGNRRKTILSSLDCLSTENEGSEDIDKVFINGPING